MITSARRRRSAVLAVVILGALGAAPAAAHAHTRTQETTNLDSHIVLDPELTGVSFTIHTGGLLVEVVNTSDEVLVIEGYEGEPYLRIGPDGVEHNRRSPATYLNDPRIGKRLSPRTSVAMPHDVDAAAPPDWVAVSDGTRAVWHDHRTHWMSPEPPPFVEVGPLSRLMMRANLVGLVGRAGDDAGAFRDWEIAFSFGGEPGVLRGQMIWVDPAPAWPVLLGAVLLVAGALVGLRRWGGGDPLRPAAALVLLVAVVNSIHLVDDLIAWPSGWLDDLSGLLHTILFLALGIGASLWSLRAQQGRRLALGVGSGAVLYHQGVVHLPMLGSSQFPTVWPDGLVRMTIAVAIVQAVVVAVVFVRTRPDLGDAPADRGADERRQDPLAVVDR